MSAYSLKLVSCAENLHLKPVFLARGVDEVLITTPEVNRSGLVLSGFLEHNNPDRIQICGMVEMAYLASLPEEKRLLAFHYLFDMKPPAVIITRGIPVFPKMLEVAEQNNVSVYSTEDSTSNVISDAISQMRVELAPRITRHGVLVEVYGEGILILGESGIGKSETAIELVKRGHRLIADDAVELRKVSGRSIVGSSPENIRHYVELRGVGIINVRQIYGMGAINVSRRLDLVINLEQWEAHKNYSIISLEDATYDILGVEIPLATLPVKPGRNLAVLIEVAAMNNRQKELGYNAAKELLNELGISNEPPKES